MAETFTLSWAAVDLLREDLEVGGAVLPFVVPSVGSTMDERAAVRRDMYGDLDRVGLTAGGRPVPMVTAALRLLVHAPRTVIVMARLEDGQTVEARAVGDGERGYLVTARAGGLRFAPVVPGTLARVGVGLIPDEKPVAARSVTVPVQAGESGWEAAPQGSVDRADLRRLLEQPRTRGGLFTVSLRAGDRALPDSTLGWFDTRHGRFLMHTVSEPDGRRWVSYAPADNARLVQVLQRDLARAGEPVAPVPGLLG
jgi:hypothetical protein